MRWPRPTMPRKTPIRCDDVQESISARLDHEALTVSGRGAQRHLATCATCRAYAEALGSPQSGLHQLTREARLRSARPAPPYLAAAAISQQPPPRIKAPARHQTHRKPAVALAGRYAAAVTPVIAAIIAIHIGLPSHINVAPTHQPTACTRYLTSTHTSTGPLPQTRSRRNR